MLGYGWPAPHFQAAEKLAWVFTCFWRERFENPAGASQPAKAAVRTHGIVVGPSCLRTVSQSSVLVLQRPQPRGLRHDAVSITFACAAPSAVSASGIASA